MPTDIAANNRRIAKNTLYLYGRMLFSLVVSLFTARIVFNALGVHDYGVLNVVGGFVSMLTYLNMLLQQGTSRFVTIALGRGNIEEMKQTFSGCLTMHLIIAIVAVVHQLFEPPFNLAAGKMANFCTDEIGDNAVTLL